MTAHEDEVLACRAAAGDREAFVTLLERHYARIYRVASRALGDADEAADLAQDVCEALPAKLSAFRGGRGFANWLYRVVVNAATDARRRRLSRQRNEALYAEVNALKQPADAARASQVRWLRRALQRLPDHLRNTAVLVLDVGLRHSDAGEALGVSESTISWRMHEVRKRLRTMADDDDVPQPRD